MPTQFIWTPKHMEKLLFQYSETVQKVTSRFKEGDRIPGKSDVELLIYKKLDNKLHLKKHK